ncbi:MAG: DUF3343 domain-containing protein [Fusobacteriaceae bacterium]
MIREEKFLILVADSTHLIIKTEILLKNNSIKCRVIPLPAELKASCGLSVKCEVENLKEIKKILNENKIEAELEFYKVYKIGLKKSFEKI